MSIATICLAIACALPLVCTGLAKRAGVVDKTFDNNEPRTWLAKQTGAAGRANAAQANSWEALAVFAAGVLSAQHLGAPTGYVDVLGVTFVIARVVYIVLYMADLATLRSAVWFVGYGASMALFFANLIG